MSTEFSVLDVLFEEQTVHLALFDSIPRISSKFFSIFRKVCPQ